MTLMRRKTGMSYLSIDMLWGPNNLPMSKFDQIIKNLTIKEKPKL